MDNTLFRKKSMDRVSSPEQLNDYIRVTSPSVWLVLTAVIVLLAGICVWGIFGRLETTVTSAAQVKNHQMIVYVSESDIETVAAGMKVTADGKDYQIDRIEQNPVKVTSEFDGYMQHIGNMVNGDWVYEAYVNADLADGVYKAVITTESVSPMSFITN